MLLTAGAHAPGEARQRLAEGPLRNVRSMICTFRAPFPHFTLLNTSKPQATILRARIEKKKTNAMFCKNGLGVTPFRRPIA